ncbi:hypothetical protein B0T10DRAFT_388242, partial [Thelonectria olida]
ITLRSNDGTLIPVGADVVQSSERIQGVMNDHDEAPNKILEPGSSTKTLNRIITWCEFHHRNDSLQWTSTLDPRAEGKLFNRKFISGVHEKEILEITIAADFLGIPSLLEFCLLEVAQKIR